MQDLLSLTIFGSFLGFVLSTIALLVVFFWAEFEEQGLIAFFGVIAYLTINHYWGNVPVNNLLSIPLIASYLGAGLIYAIFRTYFYGRSIAKKDTSLEKAIRNLKGNVFRWWFIWPVSLISWLVSDFIVEAFEFTWDYIGSSFRKILAAGYNSKKKSQPNQ